jgi:hypothetical protein
MESSGIFFLFLFLGPPREFKNSEEQNHEKWGMIV